MSRFSDAVKAFWLTITKQPVEIEKNEVQDEVDIDPKIKIKNKILRKHYEAGALCALAMLQKEARFIDFLQQDIDNYDDGQIGQLVRKIHGSCRKILDENFAVQQIIASPENNKYTVDKKFDKSRIKLVGNVPDMIPFEGSVRHCGWEARKMKLPERVENTNHKVIVHAEVGF